MSITKYADSTGLTEFWSKVKSHVTTAISGKQDALVSGTNIKTINNNSLLGSGNIEIDNSSKNVWYGIGTGEATDATRIVTTTSGDFKLQEGNIICVLMEHANNYNGQVSLNVDNTGVINVTRNGSTATRYFWYTNEVVFFVYDGTNFAYVNKSAATTSYYGITKLSSSTSSTSTALAATPSAVKAAYDLANDKQDALVSGTNIKTINNTSLLGSGNIAVQPTLVSGTNIKTINNTSLLGSGNISISVPSITYGTTDLTPGSSALTTGAIYLVYE